MNFDNDILQQMKTYSVSLIIRLVSKTNKNELLIHKCWLMFIYHIVSALST